MATNFTFVGDSAYTPPSNALTLSFEFVADSIAAQLPAVLTSDIGGQALLTGTLTLPTSTLGGNVILSANLPTPMTSAFVSDAVSAYLNGTIPLLTGSATAIIGNEGSTHASTPKMVAALVSPNNAGDIDASLTVPTSAFVSPNIVANSAGNLTLMTGNGVLDYYRHIVADLPSITGSSTGLFGYAGDLQGRLNRVRSSITGGSYGLRASLPKPTFQSVSHAGISANLNGQLPLTTSSFDVVSGLATGLNMRVWRVMRGSLSGSPGRIGSINAELPLLETGWSHIGQSEGRLSGRLKKLTSSSTGYVTLIGNLSGTIELGEMTSSIQALTTYYATVGATFGSIEGLIRGDKLVTHSMTHVTNTLTSAVTTYGNYPYNSMVFFNGAYYGASGDGVFKLDDTLSDEVRSGLMKTGKLHFGSEMQKRMSDFYIGMRSKGDITLRVTTDELDPYEYTIQTKGVERLKQRRSPIGKGAKGKYWEFELECSDDFEYDTMNATAVVVSRRL
jgi:hypothetical protein